MQPSYVRIQPSYVRMQPSYVRMHAEKSIAELKRCNQTGVWAIPKHPTAIQKDQIGI